MAGVIRVLIVDDSPTVRELLTYILGSDPEIEVVGTASDGAQAIRMTEQRKPDVITMDLHMPGTDGIEATKIIMQTHPTPIVVVSGSDDFGEASAAMRAIEVGALAMVKRPFGPGSDNYHASSSALLRVVKSMAEVKVVRRWPRESRSVKPAATRPVPVSLAPRLVVIGTSTGGPAALRDILEQLTPEFPLPIVIVQHMSLGFVGGYASWLSQATGFPVHIGQHGQSLSAGCAYLAPDGMQMGVTRDLHINLVRAPAEHGMCPSVSYLFRSIHRDLCPRTIAVLLTGMGKDGAQELKQLKDKGAVTIVQDRATSAVHGMPGEAIRLDAAMMIMSSREIGNMLVALGSERGFNTGFLRTGDAND